MHGHSNLQASRSKLLKKDIFGRTEQRDCDLSRCIRRDTRSAHWSVRWIARKLLAREARALAVLEDIKGVPKLLTMNADTLERTYIEGLPMQEGKPANPDYFRAAARLIRRHHRYNIAHNDLAKEPNFLVTATGEPAIIDYQLAYFAPTRGLLFRVLAREDIRHLLKHKRTYCPDMLTKREKRILDNPSVISKVWANSGKRIYLFVTRRILGWRDREGASDRI